MHLNKWEKKINKKLTTDPCLFTEYNSNHSESKVTTSRPRAFPLIVLNRMFTGLAGRFIRGFAGRMLPRGCCSLTDALWFPKLVLTASTCQKVPPEDCWSAESRYPLSHELWCRSWLWALWGHSCCAGTQGWAAAHCSMYDFVCAGPWRELPSCTEKCAPAAKSQGKDLGGWCTKHRVWVVGVQNTGLPVHCPNQCPHAQT